MPRPGRRAKRFARRKLRGHMHHPPSHHGSRHRRGGFRGPIAHPMHRRRRILRHGRAAIFLLAGATAAVKLSQEDVERIQGYTGKSAEELTDHELLAAMERLGIEQLDFEQSDQESMRMPKLASQCPSCGYPLTVESAYWSGPMSAKCPACNVGLEIEWVSVQVPKS